MSELPNIWTGKLLRLRAIEPEDWEQFYRWNLDSDAERSGYWVNPTSSREGQRKWTEAEATKRPTDDTRRFVLETLAGEMVGSMNIHDADTVNGTFEYGIYVGREHWGNGYAGDAIAIALRFMFRERRYQKANATVYAFNDASIALHRKLGFVEEGRIRRNHFADGQYHDELWFGMTAEEFEERLAGGA